jgi:hypothetical protein
VVKDTPTGTPVVAFLSAAEGGGETGEPGEPSAGTRRSPVRHAIGACATIRP